MSQNPSAPPPGTEPVQLTRSEEEAHFGLSQWRLMIRKFRRSRTAIIGGIFVLIFYLVALFADFLAPYGGDQRNTDYLYAPPQARQFDFQTGLYINSLERHFDSETLTLTYSIDTTHTYPVLFFVHDQPYKILGLIESDVHLYGTGDPAMGVFLMGTDRQGRDMLSRILIGAQMSLTIGLVGVILSLIIGTILGVTSGYFGGWIDNLMQRMIEVIRSFPSIPLWMALSASLRTCTPLPIPHWTPREISSPLSADRAARRWPFPFTNRSEARLAAIHQRFDERHGPGRGWRWNSLRVEPHGRHGL